MVQRVNLSISGEKLRERKPLRQPVAGHNPFRGASEKISTEHCFDNLPVPGCSEE
jgi:hypothetical protein